MLSMVSFILGAALVILSLRTPDALLKRVPLPGELVLGPRSLRVMGGGLGALLAYLPVRAAADNFFASIWGQAAFWGLAGVLLLLAWSQRR